MKRRSLIALVLVVSMLFSLVGAAFAAPSDVEDAKCEDAVVRLGALDIINGYEDGTFRPDNTITRAEFAKVIVAAVGVGDAAQYSTSGAAFPDTAGHWAQGYINVAADMGIVNGYPDGNFLPENNVSYAEAIKMIVVALGYEPKAQALGGFPGGYLAVAAEKNITSKVSFANNLAATRGDIAIMVDASLDVDLMEQETFGQYPEYKEQEGKNLLNTKLDVTEIENDKDDDDVNAIVTAVPLSDSSLDDDEIEIDGEDYTVLGDIDINALFGYQVKAWANDDDEIFFVEVETDEDDVLFDSVDEKTNDDELDLVVEGDQFDWAKDAVVYVNFQEVDVDDVEEGMYGKVILEKGDVRFASFFDFEETGVAIGVDGDIVEYVDVDTNELELDLEDYDDIYAFAPDFTAISTDEIDANSALFFYDDDDDEELYIIVKNEVVEGELERARVDNVKIDGTTYDRSDLAIATLDLGDDYVQWDAIEDIEDLVEEAVYIVLDLNGDALFISGDVDVTSETVGVVTWAETGRTPELTVFNGAGEEVTYDFEERSDLTSTHKLLSSWDFDTEVAAVEFELNKDGEIEEGTANFKYNDTDEVTLSKDKDDKYVQVAGGRYYINEDTVIIKALDSDGELDPKLQKFEDIVETSFSGETALVFGDMNKDADLIVFTDSTFVGTGDDVFYGVVTSKPMKDGSDWYADIDVFEEGEDEYKLEDEDDFTKGTLVAFVMNSDGEAEIAPSAEFTFANEVAVEDKDGSYLDLSGDLTGTFRIDSRAVVYDLDEDNSLDGKANVSRIKAESLLQVLLNDGDEIVAAKIYDEKAEIGGDDQVATDGTVTYINAGATPKYIDLKNGATIEVAAGSALDTFLGTPAYVTALEGTKISVSTNNAGEARNLTAVELEAKTYTTAFINALLAIDNITVAGQSVTTTQVAAGAVTVAGNDVTLTKVKVNGNLTVNGDDFTSKSNHIVGNVNVVGDNASFNTRIDGNVVVGGENATFSNVEFASGTTLTINLGGSAKLAGTTGDLLASSITVNGTIDTTDATNADVKAVGADAQAAADASAVASAKAAIVNSNVLSGSNVLDKAIELVDDETVTVTIKEIATAGDASVTSAGVITGTAGETKAVTFEIVKGEAVDTKAATFTLIAGEASNFEITLRNTADDADITEATAGTNFKLKLTAKDDAGNTVTGYAGAKSVQITGFGMSAEGNFATGTTQSVTFTAGVGTTADINAKKAETVTITVTIGEITGTKQITVVPGAAATMTVTPATFATVAQGASQQFTATIVDAEGNPVADETVTFDLYEAGGTTAVSTDSAFTSASVDTNALGQASSTLVVASDETVAADALKVVITGAGTGSPKTFDDVDVTAE